MAIAAANRLQITEDYYHAAQIMNHGDTIEDARIAHLFALHSCELGYRPSRWLEAASYDRWQMHQGKPHKFGTNYVYDGREDRLWDVDPGTTDEERAKWDVPPLVEQLRKAQEANRHKIPISEEEQREFGAHVPEWLRAAMQSWRAEQNNLE